jgi:hypothetical protein
LLDYFHVPIADVYPAGAKRDGEIALCVVHSDESYLRIAWIPVRLQSDFDDTRWARDATRDTVGKSLITGVVLPSSESYGYAGDQYIGLDRFGRVVDQRWVASLASTQRRPRA